MTDKIEKMTDDDIFEILGEIAESGGVGRLPRQSVPVVDESRKDAERYRWLREHWFTMTSVYGSNGTVKFQINQNRYSDATEATIDAAIDAAIAQEGSDDYTNTDSVG